MPKSSKKNLRDSLRAHQMRVEQAKYAKIAKGKALSSTEHSAKKKKRLVPLPTPSKADGTSSSTPSSVSKGKGKAAIPFYEGQRILLMGEGNFSFTLSLLETESIHVSPSLLVATSYDSEKACFQKYPEAKDIVERIRIAGGAVYFEVDATRLEKHKGLRSRTMLFDAVVFNFPHVGAGIKDQDRNILINQQLILGFLQSVAPFLVKGSDPSPVLGSSKKKRKHKTASDDEAEDAYDRTIPYNNEVFSDDEGESMHKSSGMRGSVLITLREAAPYTLWNLPKLAKNPPPHAKPGSPPNKYKLVRSFVFQPEAYQGYEHRRTIGGATGFQPNEDLKKGQGVCRTWEFVLADDEGSGPCQTAGGGY